MRSYNPYPKGRRGSEARAVVVIVLTLGGGLAEHELRLIGLWEGRTWQCLTVRCT